jgi:uncharacterized membrane protein
MQLSRNLLHRSFRTGITLKGLDGLLESVAGILLVVHPDIIRRIGIKMWISETLHDPTPLAPHLAHASEKLANASPHFAAMYLLAHGIAKVLLVAALWMNKIWAYPAAIVGFSGFVVWEIFRFTHTHSIALILLALFDLAVIALIWMEYSAQKERQRRSRE